MNICFYRLIVRCIMCLTLLWYTMTGSNWVQFDLMTKMYCKILRCMSYYTYIYIYNVLNIFNVVSCLCIWRCDKSTTNRISAVLALTIVCLKCLIAARASLVTSVFDVLSRQHDAAAGTTLRIVLLYRTSCACNKTTNAGANHSGGLCQLLVKY